MRSMFKLITYLWNFLRDLGAVVTSIGLLLFLAPQLIDGLSDFTPIIRIVIFSLFFLMILFLLGILRTRFIKWKNTIETKGVENEIAEIGKTLDIRNFDTVLPNEKTIKKWLKIADSKARQWSSDALRDDFNMEIMMPKSEKRFYISAKVSYVSRWKNEMLGVYFGFDKQTESFRKLKRYDNGNQQKLLFKYPNWRKAVAKAVEKISTQKLQSLFIMLRSNWHEKGINIWLGYSVGKVDHQLTFIYDGKTLVNSDDGTKIRIP